MTSLFPRYGFRVWTSLLVLAGGITFGFAVGSLIMFEGARSSGVMREVWSSLLLLSLVGIWGITLAEVWSICINERFLFGEEIESIKQRHPKGFRIARLWFFSLLWMSAATAFAYFSLFDGQDEHNFMALAVAVLFDGAVIWYAAHRTRKIMLRKMSMFYGYGH